MAWGDQPDTLTWVTETLGSVPMLGMAPGAEGAAQAPEDLFREAVPVIRGIHDFATVAFVAVDEDGVGFRVAAVDPPERAAQVEAEVRHHAESGTFGWSLYQRRPVVVPGYALSPWTVLHVVATPSRVLGMFMGGQRGSSPFMATVSQRMLSIVLSQVATMLETRHLYQELAAYNASLEGLVEERTRELRHSEAEARAATRAKSDFLANMSHEIRTPIHGILGFTRLLLDSGLRPAQAEQAAIIQRSADGLLAIVNDLLDYSKVEAGRLELERDAFDLRLVLEDVVALVAPRAAGKPVDLALHFTPEAPRHVVGDPGRLRQIVLNLVANAVRFTDRGHVVVRVRRGSGGGVEIAVEDTGVGIPAEKVESMFEKFAQGDPTGGRARGGTGLGLSIARTLARLMDGDVTAASVPGAGSTFTVSLPFMVEVQGDSAPTRELAGADVLVVTASPVLAASVSSALHGTGASAVGVDPGTLAGHAGALPDAGACAAVLVDGSGGMAGLEAAAVEARRAWGDDRPALWALLTPDQRVLAAALPAAGFAGWIPKPVREARLRAALGGGPSELPVRPAVAVPFPGVRVLLADDDDVSLRLGTAVLERMGCTVTAVRNGREALEAAEREPFEIIFLDGSMPVLDGYQAVGILRARPHLTGTAIIALTASASAEDRSKALAAGMDDHVSKPTSPEILARTVARWTGSQVPSSPDTASWEGTRSDSLEMDGRGLEVPALDEAAALLRVGGDRDLMGAQVQLLLEHWPRLRTRMVEAWQRGDADELRALAHRLKGGAGAVAATRLHRAAGRMEARLTNGHVGRSTEVVESLDRAVDGVRAHLVNLAGSGGAA
jgi:signal transduction histidine kinase/DNA-binding response OmpR family regulator